MVEAGYDVPALAEYLSFSSNAILLKFKCDSCVLLYFGDEKTQDFISPNCKVILGY